MPTAIKTDNGRVVIAVDPHKSSWTAVVVDTTLQPLARVRVPVTNQGYRTLRRFARQWPDASWAIEGARGLGAPLVTRLSADHISAIDVPAKLAARVRVLSIGHGRKTDDTDALSVGIAALTSQTLNIADATGLATAMRAVVDHRDDLVKVRTQTINRLHIVLTHLIAGGAKKDLTAEHAAELLRAIRASSASAKTFRTLAVDLISEVRHLDRRIAKATRDIETTLNASGSTLTELHGIGAITAAKILSRVGDVDRFPSAATFASYTGTAPIDASSGDQLRHRLSRAGDRQLNYCLHIMAITQLRRHPPAKAYYQRKRSEGKTHKEALRCLKRRLSDIVYRQLQADRHHIQADPGGHSGAALSSRAAG